MKLDASWATAVVAVCALVTALVNRCDAKKTDKAIGVQFGQEYFQQLRDAPNQPANGSKK